MPERPAPAPKAAAPEPAQSPLLSWFEAPGSPAKLRAHYHPAAGRFSHPLLQAVPWFDALLLAVAFVLFHHATALVPAETLDLPAAPFEAGARSALPIVVRALPARAGAPSADAATNAPAPILVEAFLADEAFDLSAPGRADAFRTALKAAAKAAAETNALVYMEDGVSHGDALRLAALLRDAELRSASFVVRPPDR